MLKTNDVENFIFHSRTDIDNLGSTDSLLNFSKCESFTDINFNVLKQSNFNLENTYTYSTLQFTTKRPNKLELMKHYEMLFKINYPSEFFEKIYNNKYLSLYGYDTYINEIVCFTVINVDDNNNAEILSFGVVKEFQGKRIGSKLLNKVLEELTNMGINRVGLIVSKHNNIAFNLYNKFGFIVKCEDPNYYTGLDLESGVAYLMVKDLQMKRFWIFEVFRRITRKVLSRVSCNLLL
jgi:ribosomal-protein-alanine N-acetyltransferase